MYLDDADIDIPSDTEHNETNQDEDMELDYDDRLDNLDAMDTSQEETRDFVYNTFPEADRSHLVQENSFHRSTFKWPNEKIALQRIKRMREAEQPYKRPTPTQFPGPDTRDPPLNTNNPNIVLPTATLLPADLIRSAQSTPNYRPPFIKLQVPPTTLDTCRIFTLDLDQAALLTLMADRLHGLDTSPLYERREINSILLLGLAKAVLSKP